jgi:glycosidase
MYEQAENHIIFLDNHDLNRFWTVIEEDMDKFKMGITLLMTTRGIPMLYYGTELLFEGRGGAFGEHGRIDFPGGWSDDASSKFTEKGRTALEEEAFQFVRKLVRLRTSSPLSSGKLIQYIPDNGLYVFFRLGEETSFMIAVNRSKQKRQLHCSKYKEVLKSKVVGFDHITEQQLDLNKLEIEPNQTFLIQY